jgi:uncharacterized repeat protein (TIGR01451 family)
VVAATATSDTSSPVTTHIVALPSGIQSGDLLLVFWADGSLNSSVNIPPGWIQLYITGTNYKRMAMYRIADGTEGSTRSVITSSGDRSAHNSYRISAGTYTGVPVYGTVVQGKDTTPNPPNLVSGFGAVPTLWIAASHSGGDDNTPPPEPPTNYTGLITGYSGAGSSHARMATARRELTVASEDPGSFTLGLSVTWGANTVAIAACLNATLSRTSAPGTDSQGLCLYDTITNITYSVGGNATGAYATGLPTGVTGVYNTGVFTISGAPTQSGSFNYSVISAGTPAPCAEDTAYGSIMVYALPVVTCPADTSVCLNAAAFIPSGATPPGGNYSGPGMIGGHFHPSAAGVGTWPITYTYTNATNCTDSCTFDITVMALPAATIDYPGSPYCATGTATVIQTGQSGGTYSSTAGLAIDPASGAINLETSTPGTYSVLYAFSDGACSDSTTAPVTVYALPTVTCPADYTVYINTPDFPLTGGSPGGGTYSGTGVSGGRFYPSVAGYGIWPVTYTYTDGNGCTDSCEFNITVADRLNITKTTVSVPLKPGDAFNYQLTYYNLNDSTAAQNVTITDTLPADSLYTYVSSTPPGSYDPVNQTITWFFPSIPASSSGTITINGISGWPGGFFGYDPVSYYICSGSCTETASNLVTLENPLTSPVSDQVDNTVPQFCNFEMPDTISGYIKSATPTTIYYVITITNTGNITDKFVFSFALNLPPSQYLLNIEAQTLNGVPITETPWLEPGEAYTFRLAASIVTGTPPVMHNYASFFATSFVCKITKSTYIHTITYGGQIPGSGVDLVMVKTAPSPVLVDANLVYTLVVENVGVDQAKEIAINDVLPTSVTYVSAIPPPTAINGNILNWNWPNPLDPNASPIVITITVIPSCSSMPGVINVAYASSKTTNQIPEIDPSNNIDTLYTEVISNITAPTVNGATICRGETATLTASGAASGFNYHWYDAPVAGNLLYTGNPFTTPVLTATTVYYVSIFDVSDPLCESSRTAVTVIVLQPPVITLQPLNSVICEGQNTSFTISADGQSLSYQWEESTDGGATFNGVANAPPYSGVHTPVLSINNVPFSFNGYQYRCLVTTGTCSFLIYTNPAILSVYHIPVVTAVNACLAAGPVTFTQASGEPGGTWWVSGGGTINASGVFTPAATGCYEAAYTTPTAGCSDTASFVVFPAAPPVPVVNNGCGPVIVTPPPAVNGFDNQYSFDDGVTWGGNTPPTADNCAGYKIKTRYVTSSACGNVPAGTASGTAGCQESPATTRIVDMTAPGITCPANVNVMADPGMSYATVTLTPPLYSDNCTPFAGISIQWTMSFPTAGSGSGVIPVPFLFNVGITTVTYTATDACGNSGNCVFTVTVIGNDPPEIICAADIFAFTDSGSCTATLDPGTPDTLSGSIPFTWQWIMTGATVDNGTGNPIVPNPYTFNIDTTYITWIATNIAGADTCTQMIVVTDNEAPTFTLPTIPNGFCVTDIYQAVYNPVGTYPIDDLTYLRPDYYTLVFGDTIFDIQNLDDNCSSPLNLVITWDIDLATGTSLSGSGQLSGAGPIQFPIGENIIYYTLTDPAGNSNIQEFIVLVLPRPDIQPGF